MKILKQLTALSLALCLTSGLLGISALAEDAAPDAPPAPDRVLSDYVSGESKWKADAKAPAPTTAGVEVAVDKDAKTIVVTIPEGHSADIHLDLSKAFSEAWDGVYMPGGASPYYAVKVVNHSARDYAYADGSLYIGTFHSGYDPNTGHTYDPENDSEDGVNAYLTNVIGFDGNIPAYQFGICRTSNAALKALYGTTKNVTLEQAMDSALDAKLKEQTSEKGEQLYPGGINNLDQYYLDYFNVALGTTHTRLEDFTPSQIANKILGGNNINTALRETNSQIGELGYNFFYNELVGIVPQSAGVTNDTLSQYAIGAYMRGKASYNAYGATAWAALKTGAEGTLEPMAFFISGPLATNSNMRVDFGFSISFDLTDVTPPPVVPDPTPDPGPTYHQIVVNYLELGTEKVLNPRYTTSGTYGSSYDVSGEAALAIDGYRLDHTEGVLSDTLRGRVTVNVYYTAVEEEIPGEETPKDPLPPVGPEVDIPEPEPPMTDLPVVDVPGEETTIVDPETPLGNLPQTGSENSAALVWAVLSAGSALTAAGLVLLLSRKKEH